MSLVFDPWAIPGLVVVAFAGALAGVVWKTGPARPVNRRLAALLLVEALNVFASFSVAVKLTDDAVALHAWAITVFILDVVLIAAYLAFLGVALPTPLVAPFRSRAAPWWLGGSAAASASKKRRRASSNAPRHAKRARPRRG